ncbi:MAG: ATP-binding cassette domain-containing protein [Verrucomicrobia bacterium]|nr:ATP-binding cassette domain-containing protein [Verrucomicrobiota bacterium]
MTKRLPAPLPWLGALLAIYLCAPFFAAIPQGILANWQSINATELWRALAVSVSSATLSVALILIAGVPLAYCLARVPGRAMALLGFIVQLPLALPPLASGVLLLFLVGPYAPLGLLGHGALTDSFTGIVLAETFVAAPFLIVAACSAFVSVDPVLEDVAATLGRGRLVTFINVSLPLAWPAIRVGLLLAWLRAFGEFGATVMVAYHPYSLPVYMYVAFGSQGLPAMMPILIPAVLTTIAVFALSNIRTGPALRRAKIAVGASPARTENGARSKPISGPYPKQVSDSGLTFQFRRRLGRFELDVAWRTRARRLAILGPSGSGKTLTLRLLAGLDRADPCVLRLGERDLSRLPAEARGVAYVPQNYALFPHMTVARQVLFPAGAEVPVALHWMDRLGLSNLQERLPAALSLGQQQRVALARALVRPATLVLLDEPFSALDAPLRRRLRGELRQLQRDIEATMVVVTHDPDEAAALSDEILVLDQGRVLQAGTTEAVFERPASETVARLLGAENVAFGIAVSENQIEIGNGVRLAVAGPPMVHGEKVGWSIRPEDIRLSDNGCYEATVQDIASFGAMLQLSVRLGGTLLSVLAHRSVDPAAGPCRLNIDPRSIQVWKV